MFRRLFLLFLLVPLLSSCASLRLFEPPPPPGPSTLDIAKLDTSPLHKKRIVIDPGHGGRYHGAVGNLGIRESEINLWVGLYLWGLLSHGGADAVLTRTADVELGPGGNSELKDDLKPRVDVSNSGPTDLFVSLHHNSNIHDRVKNQTEVYYTMTDTGPSLDAARAISGGMDGALGLGAGRVLPGNYYVLRNNKAPAVLGEASYLSHRDNERQLSFHGTLRKEAEAYFLGILDYFAKGVPVITDAMVTDTDGPARPVFSAVARDDSGGGIAPGSVTLSMDGEKVMASFNPDTGRIDYQPSAPLTNTTHTFSLTVRNMKGNISRTATVETSVSLPPAWVEVRTVPSAIPPDGATLSRVSVRVADAGGNPVADGTPVEFSATAGTLLLDSTTTMEGTAITYLKAPATEGRAVVTATTGAVSSSIPLDIRPLRESLIQLVVTGPGDAPLEGVEMVLEDNSVFVSDQNGRIMAETTISGEHTLSFQKKGYRFHQGVAAVEQGLTFIGQMGLAPEEGGILLGRVIAVDPEIDPDEKEASKLNLRLAAILKERLGQAGAQVVVSREGEKAEWVERIMRVNSSAAELLVSVGHRKSQPFVDYYFMSKGGKVLAVTLGGTMKDVIGTKATVRESGEPAVVHSRMPAVVVNFGLPKEKHRDDAIKREAETIYKTLLAYFAPSTVP